MGVYHFQAIDEKKRKKKGFIEASNEAEARQKLRDQGVLVTRLSSTSHLKKGQNLNHDALLAFTTLFSQLVSAGIPLYESLVAIEEQVRGESYHRIALSLAEQVKSGLRLSDAMKSFPDSFSPLYIAMISAAEASGALSIVLQGLCLFLAKQAKMRKQISNALIYPAILASFAFIVIVMLLGFVVPSIEGVFEGRKLNGYTEFVLGVSHFFRSYFWILLPLVVGFFVWGYFFLKKPQGKLFLEQMMLKIPIVRDLLIEAALVRFSRTMATLQEGGLPLVEALSLSRAVMQNHALEEEILRAEQRILEGGSLSVELKRSRLIPLMASRMIAIGEETGRLSQMLGKVADMYEDHLEKTIERIMSLMQPAILIVMGAVIGLVLLAILLPMTDISSLTTH